MTSSVHEFELKENSVTVNNTQQEQSVMDIIFGNNEPPSFVTKEDFLVSSTLILDAKYGRNMNFRKERVKAYLFYNMWHQRALLYLSLFINLALAIFEKPAVPNFELSTWATMLIEFLCLLFFIFRIIHTAYVEKMENFCLDRKYIIVIIIIVLTILDMLCYIVWIVTEPRANVIRWSRSLRPFLCVNFPEGRQVRQAFRNIRRSLPEVFNIFILFTLTLCLFALLALKLYSSKNLYFPDGTPYFQYYIDAVWQLYILVTTANNPDVMMPAYDYSNWWALFFVVVIIVLLYTFMSIVLAAIYNSYRDNLKNEVKEVIYAKRRKLTDAFEILQEKKHGHYVITKNCWMELMKYVVPKRSVKQHELLLHVLDQDQNNSVKKTQFLYLADLLMLPLTEVWDRMTLLEKYFPRLYNSPISSVIKTIVKHRFFRWFFDILIFINAWIIGFSIKEADWFFLSIFFLEILFKLYTFGGVKFFKQFWNMFDFFVVVGALILTTYNYIENKVKDDSYILDLFLVMRVLRLFRTFASIKRFRLIIMTIVNITPSIFTYGAVMLVFYYFYAVIGMEIFHGLIQFHGYNMTFTELNNYSFCGNAKLRNSNFYHDHYCSNNFNDILKSFVILFELTVVNQWHVLTSGFVLVTHPAARLYFLTFHICCVVIVLNIFTAFILEAFVLEYTLSKGRKLETVLERTLKKLGFGIRGSSDKPFTSDDSDSDLESIPDNTSAKGLQFHIKKKSKKTMHMMLQEMFEEEIEMEKF